MAKNYDQKLFEALMQGSKQTEEKPQNTTPPEHEVNDVDEYEVAVTTILLEAKNNPVLLDEIQERASIRWVEGYSDTLHDAVLCKLKTLGATKDTRELSERDKTDWQAELDAVKPSLFYRCWKITSKYFE